MTCSGQSDLRWRKSSHSDGTGGECVEVAAGPGGLLVRDSKDPEGARIGLTLVAARNLLSQLRAERS
ncbi:DUF397 domain-containing protein [Actinomadura luteofluorescens]|uniref:DUF397 domain-containing protein n=1 Tax=Actinomadura luteofluorescens TaxID=46163 RepID=UPI002164C1F6|nr:DUF397 domain-containing protein [Actinomadura glauciflava]